ncbi:MAG: acetolactate synthase small subunit [Candidatus Omnitrophota bacterium]
MKHTIAVIVENKPGVLARISGLFSARGFNITSLAVGETNDPTLSRMTIIVDAKEERILEQIKKQLHKLIDVLTVLDLTKKNYFERELVLMKISTAGTTKPELSKILKKYSATILSFDKKEAVLEIVGDNEHIGKLLGVLGKSEIKELVRTGRIAIAQ